MRKSTLFPLSCLIFIFTDAQQPQHKASYIPPFEPRVATFNGNYTYSDYNYKTKYVILKKDSTGIQVNSKIYKDDDGRYYLNTKDDSDSDHRVYANETIKISFQDQRD